MADKDAWSPANRSASIGETTAPANPLQDHPGLILVGTVHGDHRGFLRIMRFLQSFHPDLILVELSPYAKTYRDRNQVTLLRTLSQNLRIAAKQCGLLCKDALIHPEIEAIGRQLALPFEYRAARRFSRATGSCLALVDYSRFSRRMIRLWPELLTTENLASLLRLPRDGRPALTETYDLAARTIRAERLPIADIIESNDDQPDALWEKREHHLAASIRGLLQNHHPEKAVYLGGWRHLAQGGNFPSLRELLEIEASQCYLLDRGFL
jgi:hypothetical protein